MEQRKAAVAGVAYRPSCFAAPRRPLAPGGLIPSRRAIAEHAVATGPTTAADHGFGEHDAETLRPWRERFTARRDHDTARRDHDTALGFDTVLQRMRELDLAYPEAGFRSRYLDVRPLHLTEGTHR